MPETNTAQNIIIRLLKQAGPYTSWILLAGIAVLIKELARVSVYVFMGQALDVVVGMSRARLEDLLVIEGALVLGIGIHGFLAVISMFRSSAMLIHDFRQNTIKHVIQMRFKVEFSNFWLVLGL